ncbi:MAG: succinate dehydrogenase [Deltaproteobacteria bacterium]|nr:succinate dehydrogenase [Deltaproteobacteria bacterium]
MTESKKLSFTKDEKYFFLCRLHSLSGIFPIGFYFAFHMMANAKSLLGAESYDSLIKGIGELPFLHAIEISVIAIPLLFHILWGIVIYLTAKSNVVQYPFCANWRYFLQRLTGVIGIAFIALHVWATRVEALVSGIPPSFISMQNEINEPYMALVYLIGTIALTYHLTNGIWTFLITWGATVSPRAQKVSGIVCGALFLAFSSVWIQIIANFKGWF